MNDFELTNEQLSHILLSYVSLVVKMNEKSKDVVHYHAYSRFIIGSFITSELYDKAAEITGGKTLQPPKIMRNDRGKSAQNGPNSGN